MCTADGRKRYRGNGRHRHRDGRDSENFLEEMIQLIFQKDFENVRVNSSCESFVSRVNSVNIAIPGMALYKPKRFSLPISAADEKKR